VTLAEYGYMPRTHGVDHMRVPHFYPQAQSIAPEAPPLWRPPTRTTTLEEEDDCSFNFSDEDSDGDDADNLNLSAFWFLVQI
jgi:hypothetical protein